MGPYCESTRGERLSTGGGESLGKRGGRLVERESEKGRRVMVITRLVGLVRWGGGLGSDEDKRPEGREVRGDICVMGRGGCYSHTLKQSDVRVQM